MTLSGTAVAARPHRLSTRLTLLVAALVPVTWLGVSVPTASADTTTTTTATTTTTDTLLAQFESGSLSAWSQTSGVTLSGDFAKYGAYGAEAVTTPTQGGYLNWSNADVPDGMEYARISGWVRVDSAADDEEVGIMSVKNTAGQHHFDFFRDPATGTFRWDLLSSDYALSTMTADFGQWYFVQALVDFGGPTGTTYTAQVRIDGIDQPTITSTGQAGATVKAAWFGGKQTGQTNVREYDSLKLDVGSAPFAFTN